MHADEREFLRLQLPLRPLQQGAFASIRVHSRFPFLFSRFAVSLVLVGHVFAGNNCGNAAFVALTPMLKVR